MFAAALAPCSRPSSSAQLLSLLRLQISGTSLMFSDMCLWYIPCGAVSCDDEVCGQLPEQGIGLLGLLVDWVNWSAHGKLN